ncbi:MAG TPA: hypothetical protein VME46_08320 [Acidimicrobiales bacterium]|nr:hypothetical protein [Acidimicrobiales bacterium]
MRSEPLAPVMTGNITTRNRSTTPARSSDRHRLMLPIVRRRPGAPAFIARTAAMASSRTRVVFAQESGSSRVDENTTFDAPVSPLIEASSWVENPSAPAGVAPAAKPDISRYVFAPMSRMASGCSASQPRYSGPSRPHHPGQPSADA